MSRSMLRRARANEAATASRVGRIFDDVDVVLAPTTAQPAPKVDAFDRLGPTATDRAIISACPVTFPWNLLGWPSINVPAGFTESGLPMGVQLMGPANSEPLLVSLAAELRTSTGGRTGNPNPGGRTTVETDDAPGGTGDPSYSHHAEPRLGQR